MGFAKDVLIIDFEGLKEPVQLGAVLLDKETLEEKNSLNTYIWADLKGEVKKVSGISQETLKNAPTQAEVGRMFFEKFGTNVLIGMWVAQADSKNLETILTATELDPKIYYYHILDILPAAYIHLLKQGYEGGIRSEEIFKAFGTKERGLHDALEDARIVADIVRKIVF